MKLILDIPEPIGAYLGDIVKAGLWGETLEEAAVQLIRDALVQRIPSIIPVRDFTPRETISTEIEVVADPQEVAPEPAAEPKSILVAPVAKPRRRDGALTKNQSAVLEAVRSLQGKRYRMSDIADEAGIAQGSLYFVLEALEKKGLVENQGQYGDPDWRVVEEAKVEAEPSHDEKRSLPSTASRAPKVQRRFTNKPDLQPHLVKGLAVDHAAIIEERTLFPSTVMDVEESPGLLVSGANSRKLGHRIVVGPWAGFPIFALTLEERATCPTSCAVYRECFGNGMPFARRHRHGPELIARLEKELAEKQEAHPEGFAVRLHVLGDFYSVEYVRAWAAWIVKFPALHVFGFTAHERGSGIGAEIKRLTDRAWDRFAIRFSSATPKPQGSSVIFRLPESQKVEEGYVCPAMTDKTDCCGTCGICWAPAAKSKNIVFVAHGKMGATPKKKAPKPAKVTLAPKPKAKTPVRPVMPPPVDPKQVKTAADVEEWLRKNGGPRRFENGATAQPFALQFFLKERGHELANVHRKHGTEFTLNGKRVALPEVIEFVNRIRVSEGLEPLTIEGASQ